MSELVGVTGAGDIGTHLGPVGLTKRIGLLDLVDTSRLRFEPESDLSLGNLEIHDPQFGWAATRVTMAIGVASTH